MKSKALLLLLWIASVYGHDFNKDQKNIEHTPFHKKDKNNIPLDVRDDYVQLSETKHSKDMKSKALLLLSSIASVSGHDLNKDQKHSNGKSSIQ